MNSKVALVTVGFVVLLGGSLFVFWDREESLQGGVTEGENFLTIGDALLQVEVVSEQEELARGLSGREGLGDGEGMLFVFAVPGYQGIWMKDMLFAIDIIWLDREKRVVHIEENVALETYPEVFYPELPALYVLEVQAGFVGQHNTQIGDQASWEL